MQSLCIRLILAAARRGPRPSRFYNSEDRVVESGSRPSIIEPYAYSIRPTDLTRPNMCALRWVMPPVTIHAGKPSLSFPFLPRHCVLKLDLKPIAALQQRDKLRLLHELSRVVRRNRGQDSTIQIMRRAIRFERMPENFKEATCVPELLRRGIKFRQCALFQWWDAVLVRRRRHEEVEPHDLRRLRRRAVLITGIVQEEENPFDNQRAFLCQVQDWDPPAWRFWLCVILARCRRRSLVQLVECLSKEARPAGEDEAMSVKVFSLGPDGDVGEAGAVKISANETSGSDTPEDVPVMSLLYPFRHLTKSCEYSLRPIFAYICREKRRCW